MDFHPETNWNISCLSLLASLFFCTSRKWVLLVPMHSLRFAMFNNNGKRKPGRQETMMINIKINYCSEMCNVRRKLLWATASTWNRSERRWKISTGPEHWTVRFIIVITDVQRRAPAWPGKHRCSDPAQYSVERAKEWKVYEASALEWIE